MQGNKRLSKPANVKLYGVDLPWVKTAMRLGHELSEQGNMVHDMQCKRADFIQKSTEGNIWICSSKSDSPVS